MSCVKYHATPETVKQKLTKYGVAIIPNLLNQDECEMMKTGMWNYLEHVSQNWETPLDRDNNKTWREFSNLYPKHSMLLQHFEIGHAQMIWNLRQNPKCTNVFTKIWDCNSNLSYPHHRKIRELSPFRGCKDSNWKSYNSGNQ